MNTSNDSQWIGFLLLQLSGVGLSYGAMTLEEFNRKFGDRMESIKDFTAVERNCPTAESKHITHVQVPWGVKDRAYRSIPPELYLAESSVAGGGLGVFAATFIPRFNWLGRCEGEVRHKHGSAHYSFAIPRGGEKYHHMDQYEADLSNWTRYITEARNSSQQNVWSLSCKGRRLLISSRDVWPGRELQGYGQDVTLRLDQPGHIHTVVHLADAAKKRRNREGSSKQREFDVLEQFCPLPDSRRITHVEVAWGIPHRAYRSIPPEVYVARSSIPGAGMGVFAHTFIQKFTFLGEYEGEILMTARNSKYLFTVRRGMEKYYYMDSANIELSNWTRWMNMPRSEREENVNVMQCRGRILFITNRDIRPGEELMFYYGDKFALRLGISYKGHYYNMMKMYGEI